VISPQIFWFKKARTSIPILFVLSIVINIGMWFERFVIIVTSLHRDFLPSAWDYFSPTIWDISCLLGSFGLFLTLFCLFVRFLPMVATAEVKTVLPQANPHGAPGTKHGLAGHRAVLATHRTHDPAPESAS
jgi:molybdopterin-containing oxidoreductase family membrane subunit